MRVFGNRDYARLTILAAVFQSMCLLSAADTVKPLESYPSVDRMWMGLEEGSIRPAAYLQVRSNAEGYLELLAKDGQILAEGEHWATLDPEQIDIERRSLEVDEAKLRRQNEKIHEDARDAHIRISMELHDARSKRQALLDASQEPDIPEELRKRATEAVTEIDEQIAILQAKQDPAKVEQDLQLELDEGNLQIARKRKQLQALEIRSRQVAPFAGELRISDSIKKMLESAERPGELMWLNANEYIATIVDESHYEITVTATSPVIAEIPRDELLVFLQEGQTGRLIGGEYSRTDEFDTGGEIVRNYIFRIRENSVKDARLSSGQRSLVHIYRKFPKSFRLVHKKDIAFLAPEVLAASGWTGLVGHLWPGCRVIQVGPQAIAVQPKDEN